MKRFYSYLILPAVALLADLCLFLVMLSGVRIPDDILMGSFAGLAAALLINAAFFGKALWKERQKAKPAVILGCALILVMSLGLLAINGLFALMLSWII